MSTFDSEYLDGPCHVLTEEGALRLRQLRDHLRFLSGFAPPKADEAAGVNQGNVLRDLPLFLALLAEQVDRVCAAVSRVERPEAKRAAGAYAMADAVDERFSFGLTMDQVDTLNRLSALLSAHGDVVSASETTEFVDHTLASLGQAIFESAQAVREIMREVEAGQSLRAKPSTTGVREERAVYGVVPVRVPLQLADAVPDYGSQLH